VSRDRDSPAESEAFDRDDPKSARHVFEKVYPGELVDRVVALVRRAYPDWNAFDHPRFVADEIEYKQDAARKIRELLDEAALRELIEQERFEELVARLKKPMDLPVGRIRVRTLGFELAGDLDAAGKRLLAWLLPTGVLSGRRGDPAGIESASAAR
jgi:hypothetical protein